jgi:5'-3' exonuclease
LSSLLIFSFFFFTPLIDIIRLGHLEGNIIWAMGVHKSFSSCLKKLASVQAQMTTISNGIHLLDFSIWLYVFLRSEENVLTFHQNILLLENRLHKALTILFDGFKKNHLQVIVVLDGIGGTSVKLASRQRALDTSKSSRDVVNLMMDPLSDKEELLKAMKKSIVGSRPEIDAMSISIMRKKGICIIRAPFEADSQLVELCRFLEENKIQAYIWSTDGDYVLYGIRHLVYFYDFDIGNVKILSCQTDIGKSNICRELFGGEITEESSYNDYLLFLAILLGNDYIPSIKSFSMAKSIGYAKQFAEGSLNIDSFIKGVEEDAKLVWCKTYESLGFEGNPGNTFGKMFKQTWNLFRSQPVFRVESQYVNFSTFDDVILAIDEYGSSGNSVQLVPLSPLPIGSVFLNSIGYDPLIGLLPFDRRYDDFFHCKFSRVADTERGFRLICDDIPELPLNLLRQTLPRGSDIDFSKISINHACDTVLRRFLEVREIRALKGDTLPTLVSRAKKVLLLWQQRGGDKSLPKVLTNVEYSPLASIVAVPLSTMEPLVFSDNFEKTVEILRCILCPQVTKGKIKSIAVAHETGKAMTFRVLRLIRGGLVDIRNMSVASAKRTTDGASIVIVRISVRASMKKVVHQVMIVLSNDSILDNKSSCLCPAGYDYVCAHKYAALMIIRYIQVEFLEQTGEHLLVNFPQYKLLSSEIMLSSSLVWANRPVYI